MPAYGTAPGSFSTDHRMTTCGSDAGITESEIVDFGFQALGLRVYNTCTDPLYINLAAEAATTMMGYIAGCGIFQLDGTIKTSGVGLKTTSTSTGAGLPAARPRVEIIAWSA